MKQRRPILPHPPHNLHPIRALPPTAPVRHDILRIPLQLLVAHRSLPRRHQRLPTRSASHLRASLAPFASIQQLIQWPREPEHRGQETCYRSRGSQR